MTEPGGPLVGIVMGSDSDLPVMGPAAEVLTALGVPHEVRVVSAHRTPHDMIAYGGDLWLYQTALREGVAALQGHAT